VAKSKRNTPRPDGARAQKLADRRARLAEGTAPTRPFAGLAAECDLVAMREFVPSAVAGFTAVGPAATTDREMRIATVLPGAVAALMRQENGVEVGYAALQVQAHSADAAADLGASAVWAATVPEPGSLSAADPTEESPRLQDVLATDGALTITVHQDFNWWIPQDVTPPSDVAAAVQQANQVIMPSARLEGDGVVAAWWVDAGEKAHLRWVRPEDEDALMLALARLHAAGALNLGEGSRFAGSFRTHGVLVPVFDLDREMHPDEWVAPTVALGARLADALAVDAPLSTAERRARDGIRSRQVTLR
jgi:hypothetical protein